MFKKNYFIFIIFIISFLSTFFGIFIYSNYFTKEKPIELKWWLAYELWSDNLYNWTYTNYYENSNIKLESQEYKDGKKNWQNYKYYINGKISSQSNYKNWLLNGEAIIYDEDWNVIQKNTYLDWVLVWTWYYYYPSGSLLSQENYSSWLIDWVKKTYYEDGSLKISQNYSLWKLEWQELVYSPKGIVLQDFFYKDNIVIKWKMYNENWILLSTIEFDEKSWKNILKEYDKDWNVKSTKEFDISPWELN